MMTVAPPLSASLITIDLSSDKFFKASFSYEDMLLLFLGFEPVLEIFVSDSRNKVR